jgi:hypothetical protein
MAQGGQRKCLCCQGFFFPDCRNATRQRYCPAPDCRRASKLASQAAWLARPENVGYFSGPVAVQRVQAWRVAHPGYDRSRVRGKPALQETLIAQGPDFVEQNAGRAAPSQSPGSLALQDALIPTEALLTGLIAHLFEVSLQDDIAATSRRLVQRGQDLIRGGGDEDKQARAAARAAAPSARAVQLG